MIVFLLDLFDYDYQPEQEGQEGTAGLFTLQPLRRTITFGVRDA